MKRTHIPVILVSFLILVPLLGLAETTAGPPTAPTPLNSNNLDGSFVSPQGNDSVPGSNDSAVFGGANPGVSSGPATVPAGNAGGNSGSGTLTLPKSGDTVVTQDGTTIGDITTPPPPGTNPNVGGGFISLTTIPGLTDSNAADAPDLPTFLNNLYKFCVGAAAVLAVIQLIHAGILYSVGESIGKKDEAKHLIYASLGGLALVLSPFLVYSLINPAILNLNQLNTDLAGLNVKNIPIGTNAQSAIDEKALEQVESKSLSPGGDSYTGTPAAYSCTRGSTADTQEVWSCDGAKKICADKVAAINPNAVASMRSVCVSPPEYISVDSTTGLNPTTCPNHAESLVLRCTYALPTGP